jgi:hypothetical protein
MIPPPIALANSAMPNIRSSGITRPPASPRSLVIPAAPAPSLARVLLNPPGLVSSEQKRPPLVWFQIARGLLHPSRTVFSAKRSGREEYRRHNSKRAARNKCALLTRGKPSNRRKLRILLHSLPAWLTPPKQVTSAPGLAQDTGSGALNGTQRSGRDSRSARAMRRLKTNMSARSFKTR